MKEVALELKNITKAFGTKVVANSHVDLTLYKGEVLAILGENGSGKTTLMNMIAGIYYPDEGQIFVNGKEVFIHSPKDAFEYKIGMIHQHFKLINVFSSVENVAVGQKDAGNLKQVESKIKQICDAYGFNIEPSKKVYDMSVSEKQTLEIVKVLYRGAEILILDEPTAVLTPQETEKLFNVIRNMRNDGKSIIIITHKLNEVMEISDRVAVLRKGEHVATVETAKTDESSLTDMMVGKKTTLNIERTEPTHLADRLEIRNLCCTNHEGVKVLDDISFTARAGEILGIAGIAGSGQRELLEAIAGLQHLDSGEIVFNNPKKDCPVTLFHKTLKRVKELAKAGAFKGIDGKTVNLDGKKDREILAMINNQEIIFKEDEIVNLRDKTPLQIRELGVRLSFVPEDRLGMGLVGNMDIVDNMMLRSYRKGKSVFFSRTKPQQLADRIIDELGVVTPSSHTPVRRLSGGNVQKVLVGREIASSPKVLMAAYPVRGLDINSSYLIYNLLDKQKQSGTAVVFVGEDLDVLMGLCDRIMVICRGQNMGIVSAKDVTKEQLGLMMTGSVATVKTKKTKKETKEDETDE